MDLFDSKSNKDAPLADRLRPRTFLEFFGQEDLMPLAHTGGLPHRIMAFENTSAERRWGEMRHPLYHFVFETVHADLEACSATQGLGRLANMPRVLQVPALA